MDILHNPDSNNQSFLLCILSFLRRTQQWNGNQDASEGPLIFVETKNVVFLMQNCTLRLTIRRLRYRLVFYDVVFSAGYIHI